MQIKKKKILSLSLFGLMTISIIVSIGALIFGIIQESQKVIVVDKLNKTNDYGLQKALVNDKKLSALVIKEANQLVFSKNHIETLSLYIFDNALNYSSLPYKKIKYYDSYDLTYELSNQKTELIYSLELYYQRIDKIYDFKFLIKIN